MNPNIYDHVSKVLINLGTSESGLTDKEIVVRLVKFGRNEIKEEKKIPYWVKFLLQFTDLMAIVLLMAVVLAYFLGSPKDAIVIFLVVFANAAIGFFQEFKADKTIEALKRMVAQTAIVVRNGERISIDATDIVPGDIIVLSEGMRIPADVRLLCANELETNDASLTGESEPQLKTALKIEDKKRSIVDVCGSVFMGTDVISGDGIGVVIATGMNTHFGKIAKATSAQKICKSPLQIEVDIIAKIVTKAVLAMIPVLLAIYVISIGSFDIYESFKFAIGVASSLVPEGLMATVSIGLALGVQKMARRKAIIRRLSAVETLGEADYIITDKTGTLTKNQMTVKEIYYNSESLHVEGAGYNVDGYILQNGKRCDQEKLQKTKMLFLASAIANDAEINVKKHHDMLYSGDSTELALLVAAEKAGYDTFRLQRQAKTLQEIPFTSERKYMAKAVLIDGQHEVFAKGAPNVILEKCTKIYKNNRIYTLKLEDVAKIQIEVDSLSNQALRVIAVAFKPMDKKAIDDNLVFLGLFGIIDPPRDDVAHAIKFAKSAGIKVMMATGDYGLTAAAISKMIGMNDEPAIIDGNTLDKLSDKQLYEKLKTGEVIFSRVEPIHKLRIVKILKSRGRIVCVTGDGVNDAPALKTSDIGVAMGITGTDVTKEAAEMILTNDSFSSIVWAIKEGRIVYDNIKKATKFVFISNIAEFVAVVCGLFIGIAPITVIQILLIDLCAEVFPAIALAGDDEEDDVMSKKPRSRKDVLFGRETISYLLRNGLLMGIFATVAFCIYGYMNGWQLGDKSFADARVYVLATTVAYLTMGLCQYMNAFSVRSVNKPIWKLLKTKRIWISLAISFICINALVYLPLFQDFATMASMTLEGWAIAGSMAFLYLICIEVFKMISASRKRYSYMSLER